MNGARMKAKVGANSWKAIAFPQWTGRIAAVIVVIPEGR